MQFARLRRALLASLIVLQGCAEQFVLWSHETKTCPTGFLERIEQNILEIKEHVGRNQK